eukprot:1160963-Rhodomonas_salina.1
MLKHVEAKKHKDDNIKKLMTLVQALEERNAALMLRQEKMEEKVTEQELAKSQLSAELDRKEQIINHLDQHCIAYEEALQRRNLKSSMPGPPTGLKLSAPATAPQKRAGLKRSPTPTATGTGDFESTGADRHSGGSHARAKVPLQPQGAAAPSQHASSRRAGALRSSSLKPFSRPEPDASSSSPGRPETARAALQTVQERAL